MKKIYSVLALAALTSACSTFKPDYEVVNASHEKAPKWITQENAYKADDGSGSKTTHRYFVDDATNLNQRLCLKAAETRATGKIASEIAQEILDKYQEIQESSGEKVEADDKVNTKAKEVLTQDVKTRLHGVSVINKYWEKRRYKQELGAEKDYTGFKCNVVVRLSNENLAEAISKYKTNSYKALDLDVKKLEQAINEEVKEVKAGE
ncbi:MAG: hypothetical protein MJ247_04900 [Alphaproteobacteria bacterium]|nr:hypothetical protein [Alphaproteobacteria bacterium]